MLQTFYQLREQPFGVNPDPRFLYLSRTHREAFSSLLYRIRMDSGFLALIAEPGMGKTTLLFHLLHKLQGTAKTAFIFQTQCTSHELLRQLLSEFECDTNITDPVRMSQELKSLLLAEANAGRRCVVIIDEAQNLGPKVLETIRLLSNFETPRRKLLNIILSGQAELGEMLASADLRQLRQRLSCISYLKRFTPGESALYIAHRLATAGYPGKVSELFSLHALTRIAQLSDGVPRVINNICFNALSLGYALEVSQIDSAIIEEVASDLGLSGGHQPSASGAAHPNVAETSDKYTSDAIASYKQEVSDALSEVPEPYAQTEPEPSPIFQVELPAEAPRAGAAEKSVNHRETIAVVSSAMSKWPGEIASWFSNLRRNAATKTESTARPLAKTAVLVATLAASALHASTEDGRKANATKFFVAGGSACLLALCIAPAIRLSPHVSARSVASASTSSVSATAPEDHSPIASNHTQETTAKTKARATSLSENAARVVSNRRPEIATQRWQSHRNKKMQVDLALASFAPEPLMELSPLRPMLVPARSVSHDKSPSYSIAQNTPAATPTVSQQAKTLVYVPPQAISQPAPQYPKRIGGRNPRVKDVQLLLSISSSGEVEKVGVLSGNRYLAAAAMKAVKTWKYSPATSNGNPVDAQVYITVQFQPR